MQSTHIFLVILVTVIFIIFAEYQKLSKIKWILLIGCVTYILLTVLPEKPLPISNEVKETSYPVENEIVDELTIDKPESIENIISDVPESASDMQNLDIVTIAIATNIIERTPVGVSKLFLNDINTLFCFTAVNNSSKSNSIIHTWKYDGKDYFKNIIEIGKAPYWRCWSRITIRPEMAGEWQVFVTDTVGSYLDSIEFSIIPEFE